MPGRPTSIHDIAHAAGVSHSTVSRALRDSPLISQEVRDNVQAIAKRMGYVPNAVAQSLQGQSTQTVGVLVTTVSDPFFADVLEGIEQVARPAGYTVLFSAAHNDPDEERRCFDNFRKRRVDGLIMASARGIPPSDLSAGLPLVLLNNQAERPAESIHSVSVDDRMGAQLAAAHLIELGHRQIGYIGVASRAASNQRRHQGYIDALAFAGLPADDRFVITAASMAADPDADVVAGRTLLPQLLADEVTAVFCYNDMVAIGALMACRQLGLRVPEDVSILGFDDIALARYTMPELTTVRQPREEMGRVAMQTLLSLLDGKRTRGFVAQPVLLVRSSTGPVAQTQGAVSKKPPIAAKSISRKI